MRLEGQTAIVTGGGRGIGRAVALALAREGANVTVCARTPSEIEAVATELQQLGRKALAVPADVTAATQVQGVVEQTQAAFGGVDILINNAGGNPAELYDASGSLALGELWEMDERRWDRTLEANLKSVFLCTKAVMPPMIARGRGHIVNIASAMGHGAWAIGGPYMIAKHGVIALTQSLGLTAAKHGVRVNAVSPGLIDTPGQRRFMRTRMPEDKLPPMEPPEPVAAAVVYLLCEAPPGMTGQALQLFQVR
jgi:NAD(P)-dependent dehydrogenase (short-subunit alcohol dehydrogenase family)